MVLIADGACHIFFLPNSRDRRFHRGRRSWPCRKNQCYHKEDGTEDQGDIRGILERMSMRLLEADHTGYGDSCFAETERLSGELRQEIDAFLQNQTWQDDIYFMRYVEMRREQCRVLQVIYRQLLRLNQVPEQAKPLSAFLADIAMHFHEGNDCSALLEQLESLYAAYRQDELPDTRESFENRAILYSILTELQSFLQIKRQFYLTLPEQERKQMFERLMQA